jgi:nitrogen fixation NifU-like protein
MDEFKEQIIDNYKNPHNFGIPNDDNFTSSKVTNVSCGDEIEIYTKVEEGIVSQINFTGRGCSISIASASLLSEALKNKRVEEIQAYSDENLKALIGIPLTTTRLVCAQLALKAIKNSISA